MEDQFNLIDAISIMNKKNSEKLKYDTTYKGYISGISNNNTYNVVVNGKEFKSVKSLSNTIQKGDVVLVMFPQNNPSQCFILGSQYVGGATPTPSEDAVLYVPQTLSDSQKQQARTNIGAGTSSFDGDYSSLSNKPSIPSKTSELTNDSGYITSTALSPYAKTVDLPTKTSDLTNDSGYITNAALDGYAKEADIPTNNNQLTNGAGYITVAESPVRSVNGKTGTVNLTAIDIGALPGDTVIPSKTSELVNDSGYVTSASVPASTSTAPKMDGVANVGSEEKWAKGDHVHPSDSSKLNADGGTAKNLIINQSVKFMDGDYSCDLALDKNGTTLYVANYNTSDNNTIIRSVADPVEIYDAVNLNYFNNHIPSDTPTPSSILPKKDSGNGSVGTSSTYARGDHIHPIDTSRLAQNGGEATDLTIMDSFKMTDSYANTVLISQSEGQIGLYQPNNDNTVLISGVADPVNETDAINLRSLTTVSDVANEAVSTANSANSTASSALTTANNKAPKSHASTATTYGAGSNNNYGHVKLSASTSSTSGTSGGTAATPSAVKSAYDLANKAVTTLLGGKKIVCGWSAVSFKNTSQTNTTISFGTTFTAKPVVLIGQPFNGVICTVFHDAVTTTGFTVNVPAVGSATLSTRQMAWIAIGSI